MRDLAGHGARIFLSMTLAAAVACSAVPAVVAVPTAYAAPTTPQIAAKQAEAAVARNVLADLNDDMEMKAEEYNAVTEALERTRAEIEKTRVELAAAEARLAAAQDSLASRARAMYVNGEVQMIEVLVGTSSFDDLITRVDILNRISKADAELVTEVSAVRSDVAAAKSALENRESEQIALRQEAKAKRDAVEAAVRRQQQYLTSLDAEVTRLIKEEQDRQRRIAEELARKAAEAAAKRGATPRQGGGAAGAPHPEAVAIALKYLGVPYVWGGSTPSGFDCSGLVHYVYAQLGIDLPRTSREQYRVGAFIAANRLDLLQPGDLVFFGYDGDPNQVHHVGMYVGDGNFIHAPGTGDHVAVTSLTARIAARGDYVGAVRP